MTENMGLASFADIFRLTRNEYCPTPEALFREYRPSATQELVTAQRLALTR